MMSYMEANPCFARNRISGPRSTLERNKKWQELANLLNSCATGTTKSPEKWSRCWQDWKVDVKQKAAKLRRHSDGGPSKEHRTPLTAIEERLLTFIGDTAVNGVAGIVDPDEAHSEAIRELGDVVLLEEPMSMQNSNENMQNSNEFNPEEINIVKCEELVGKPRKRKKTTVIYDSDQYDTFGEFVASEIRNLSVDYLRKKMKRRIQKVILEILEEEEMLSN